MLDVKLKVDSPMMADYLAYLFPPESEGGPLKVYARNSVGRLLVARCKISERPVDQSGDGDGRDRLVRRQAEDRGQRRTDLSGRAGQR